MKEQTLKDIDKAFKALEILENIKEEVAKMDTLITRSEVLEVIDKCMKGENYGGR